MTPDEFARKHFPNFRVRGDEILPTYCPYCHGGQHGDKFTFGLNLRTGAWNCQRGSCGASGSFGQLLKDHGEAVERMRNYEVSQRRKSYKSPQTEIRPITTTVERYLMLRGFSRETWQKYGVGDDGRGNIVFPYYEAGNLVLLKFRPGRKLKKSEQKAWREEGGKPVFWGMDLCKADNPLTITEGEMDTLALAECGIENVVSIPSGTEDLDCLDLCWDWLQQFKKIILWVDSDGPGQELQRKLINRLGAWRCWIIKSNRKDANEVLVLDGKRTVLETFAATVEVPINGLVRLADVKAFDYNKAARVKSGVKGLDRAVGGFYAGEWTCWTGTNGSGKSVFLGQVMLEAVNEGWSVCAYSGELPAAIYRYWIDLQAAGPHNLSFDLDSIKESVVARPTSEAQAAIRAWYRDKFFLYDSYGTTTDDGLFDVFTYAIQRYDCKMFMIDNLMTIDLQSTDQNYYRQQSQFSNRIAEFCQRYQVHVHLVAHPRKAQGRLTKIDVSGSGDLTNRANNVFSVYRLTETERQDKDCDTILEIFKNRFFGEQNSEVKLKFDRNSRRFYMPSDSAGPDRTYHWQDQRIDEYLEQPFSDADIPF